MVDIKEVYLFEGPYNERLHVVLFQLGLFQPLDHLLVFVRKAAKLVFIVISHCLGLQYLPWFTVDFGVV